MPRKGRLPSPPWVRTRRGCPLRSLLEAEVEAMRWRLTSLTDPEREDFLDEFTDRLYAKVHMTP